MQRHINDMMAGEHIVLIFPTYRDAREAANSRCPPGAINILSEIRLEHRPSAGWIQFGYAGMNCERLQGILADIRFVSDADLLVTSQFKDFARERSDRYIKHNGL